MLPKRRKPERTKDVEQRDWPAHRKWVRGFLCAACYTVGNMQMGRIEAAHVRVGTDGGTGFKPHDVFCIPLCEYHHGQQHSTGERTFEVKYPHAFPKGMRAKALEFARQSPVAEIRERARKETA